MTRLREVEFCTHVYLSLSVLDDKTTVYHEKLDNTKGV